MTATADQVLAVAAGEIGYYVPPGRRTKYGEWYGLPAGQWCAMFVSWCAARAGAQGIIPRHAYTPSGAQWFRDRGRWGVGVSGVQRGDVVYFDFPGEPDRISHVGLVESVNGDGSVNTIEGNTSGTLGGSQRNGGLCARKRRKSWIVGYGRPAYAGSPAPGGSTNATNADGSLTIDEDGDRGPQTIARWQEVMGTPIDGVISPRFSALIQADQQMLNAVVAAGHIVDLTGRARLAEDGVEGPRTIRVRQFLLWNRWAPEVFLHGAAIDDFDGISGHDTNKLHQHALNRATARSRRY